MQKEEYPCGQCGRPIVGRWKATSNWVSMQWTDTAPVKMRTKVEKCPFCGVENQIIEIKQRESSSLIKIKKPKSRNGNKKD